MLKNFLKVALRNLYKQRLFAAFNILGISMGIACCIVVYLFIAHVNSLDSFHANAPAIFMVNHVRSVNGTPELWATSPAPLGPALQADLPEVKRVVRLNGAGAVVKYGDKIFHETIRYTDPGFFELFSFPIRAGNPSPLGDVSGMVLSDEAAKKYFGPENPIGKQLTVVFEGNVKRSFTVQAVAAPFSHLASFSFDLLVNYSVGKALEKEENNWKQFTQATFLQLDKPESVGKVTKALGKYLKQYNDINSQAPLQSFYLDNLREISRHSYKTRASISIGASAEGVWVLGVLATLVLFMACFNYMNYSIATSTTRFKEIGVRKVLGSTRTQLIRQFIGENVLIALIALVLSLIIADTLFLPAFSRIVDFFQLRFELLANWGLILFLLLLLVGIGLLAGLYPAWYISGFNPISVLKGSQRITGTNGLIRTLLVLQFGLSMFTVAAAIITTQNAQFLRQLDVGYDQSALVVLRTDSESSFEHMRDAAAKLSEVKRVAGSQDQLGRSGDHTATLEYATTKSAAEVLRVSAQYVETLGLRLAEGRNFLPDSKSDVENAILINQSMVKSMGWQTAVGKRVRLEGKQYEVVGVVKDFNYRVLFFKIAPCVLKLNAPPDNRVLTMKVNTKDIAGLSASLGAEWRKVMPDTPFEIARQEDVYAISYDDSRRVKDIFTYVSVLTLMISAMGLFALVSLNIAKKTKEIGIRKVLGASAFNVANIVNREFFILITVAGALFLPLAYLAMNGLLDSVYIYHVPITAGAFVSTLAVVLALALLTVGSQVYKIAVSNPVKTLRME